MSQYFGKIKETLKKRFPLHEDFKDKRTEEGWYTSLRKRVLTSAVQNFISNDDGFSEYCRGLHRRVSAAKLRSHDSMASLLVNRQCCDGAHDLEGVCT